MGAQKSPPAGRGGELEAPLTADGRFALEQMGIGWALAVGQKLQRLPPSKY